MLADLKRLPQIVFNNIFQYFWIHAKYMFEFAYRRNDSEWFHGFLFRLFSHDTHKNSNKLYIASRFSLQQAAVKCTGIHFRLTFNILWAKMWRWKVRKIVAMFVRNLEIKVYCEGRYADTWCATLFMQTRAIKSNSSQHKRFVTGELTSYANS